ncbi:MAG: DUF3943 domain-containing protein, partial [Actinomycetota bacterium]|nr:DUF3943 domain-containing protein [Actinomycetota bacterium]
VEPEARIDVTDETRQPGSFHWHRAAIDLGVAMALGAAWYQSEIELNKQDFDFDRSFSEQARRLTTSDGYRFDDNVRYLNVGHSFVGSYYHLFARVNGGSMLQAMLFDFTASSVWELTVEHREVVSLNDTVTTSLGGVAFGEGLFRIGDFFARSSPTVGNRVLLGAFSPARAIAWMYGDAPRPSAAGFDEHGLARDAHHRFAFSYGGTTAVKDTGTEQDAWQSSAIADLELIDLPSYGRAGQSDRALRGGEMTRLALEYTGSHRDMQTMTLVARSSLWGKYRQNTRGAAGDDLDGYSAFLGTSTAFDLSYNDFGQFTDFLMAVHLVGPSADVTLHRSQWRLRLAADLYPDFALVRPLALDDAEMRAEGVPGPSTLAHEYYYAFGLTAAARAEASYRRARAGATIEWNGYDGVEGLDRHQDAYTSPTGVVHAAITDDPHLSDRRLKLRLYSESPLPFTDLEVGAGLDYLQRVGKATGATREREDLRFSLHATYAL